MVALTKKVLVNVEARLVKISVKVCDRGFYILLDQDHKVIHEGEGYVPEWMSEDGDYIDLLIDIDTGKIRNWKAPDAVQLERWIDESP